MTKTKKTTMERILSNKKRKDRFNKKYEAFLLSEALCEAMSEKDISVRKLAELSDISVTQIQGIRGGQKTNVTKATLDKLFGALGCSVAFLISDGDREILVS